MNEIEARAVIPFYKAALLAGTLMAYSKMTSEENGEPDWLATLNEAADLCVTAALDGGKAVGINHERYLNLRRAFDQIIAAENDDDVVEVWSSLAENVDTCWRFALIEAGAHPSQVWKGMA